MTDESVPDRGSDGASSSHAGDEQHYDLPSWVSGPLERVLIQVQRATVAAWILTDQGEELIEALQLAQEKLADAEYHIHRPLSRDELYNLASDLKEALERLCDAVPEVGEMERWGTEFERTNASLQAYLVERQRFKLRLSRPDAD